MQQEPIFHIGYHRTATTWFQNIFYPNAANAFMASRRSVRDTLIEPRAFAFDPAHARSMLLGQATGRRLIACEENLSGYIHNGGLGGLLSKEIALRLHATFPEAHVVIMLRAQPELIEACYAQYVNGGGTYTLDQYVNGQALAKGAGKHWYKAPQFALDHFDYMPLISLYRSMFGADRVHVLLYEAFRQDPIAFTERLSAQFDLGTVTGDLSFEKINASLSARDIRILRWLNLFTARSVQNKRYLFDMSKWYRTRWILLRFISGVGRGSKTRLRLSPELRQLVDSRYRKSNAALAEHLGLSLGVHGYPI